MEVELFPSRALAKTKNITYGIDNQFVEKAHAGACVGISISIISIPDDFPQCGQRKLLKDMVRSGMVSDP